MVARSPRRAKSFLREVECWLEVEAELEGTPTARRKRRTVMEPKNIARG